MEIGSWLPAPRLQLQMSALESTVRRSIDLALPRWLIGLGCVLLIVGIMTPTPIGWYYQYYIAVTQWEMLSGITLVLAGFVLRWLRRRAAARVKVAAQ
jgi:hypothetical protein